MTRTRLLSMEEFTHLVSESLDIPHAPQSLFENIPVVSEGSQKHRYPSFQRVFSRPTPMPGHSHGTPEDLFDAPRKMMTWPFSRSPRKTRFAKDEDNSIEPVVCHSPYRVTSPAATSTSSLGSILPANERLFQFASRESDEPSQNATLNIRGPPTASGHTVADALYAIHGNRSAASVLASSDRSMVRPIWDRTRTSSASEGTQTSHEMAHSERGSLDEDPTPRASSFGPRTALPKQRGRSQRLSIFVPLRNADVLALRPAVGVAPHVPSETESSFSACTSPPLSPVTEIASSSNLEIAPVSSLSPPQHKGRISRSMTPPPLSRPPPTGPLPAVPSFVPPVPPLPPLLNKLTMGMTPHSVISSPPRSTAPTTGLPPSPPGGLRLPSRLSWVNSVRAVLPSPPASPTRTLKSLTGKTSHPVSPSNAEVKRPNELKRPTSIGVIEHADGAQVRRTKSILLLGSKSKSNASLGTKRVQIHADVNLDAAPSRKPRRKSSAAAVGRPAFASDAGAMITPAASTELLVPRERRHSAPMLSSCGRDVPCADWTLSLPFCTDVPGNTILPSPLLTPRLEPVGNLEDVACEDWTLCMPLKVRSGTPTTTATTMTTTTTTTTGRDSGEGTLAVVTETAPMQIPMQLPTPQPSPTFSDVRRLDPDPEESVVVPEERPASRASLGPHVGGLDLAGGRGKRASGWYVYEWFDGVSVPAAEEEEEGGVVRWVGMSNCRRVKNHVSAFRKAHDGGARHPSKDSMSTVSTSDTVFYSARSSLLVN